MNIQHPSLLCFMVATSADVRCLVFSFEINPSECLPKGTTLKCQWRGKGNYVVRTPLKQEILPMDKMFDASSMIVPPQFRGNLMKIEISHEDIPCTMISAPETVSVFKNRKRCASLL